MRIAQVVPLQVAVPPHAYGGTERVVHNLTEALVKLGHDVTLFASGDSRTSARLVPGIDRAINFDRNVDAVAHHVAMLKEVYRQAETFDVIHSHLDYLTFPFLEMSTTPTVLTLHGRLDSPECQRVYHAYPDANYVAISKSQKRDVPDISWIGTIHHGVDVEDFQFYPNAGDYLCFVGRIAPEKRADRAIEIAQRAGIPLKIAAKVDPKDEDYFNAEIKPLLDHPLVEYLGQLDEASKRELMGKSLALVLPIDWPEPFGMVFIEALACGTPVLTCPSGSVPELLRDGVTGFNRRSARELAALVPALRSISRAGCRAYAKQRFDTRRMALEYVNIYSRVQGRRQLFGAEEQPAPALAPTLPPESAGARDQIERVALT
ncbi:MAG: glycosyltransferase family 4 protein [Ktedonobacterales bacterium]